MIKKNKNFPTIDEYEQIIELIYKNRFFTNHGPLAVKLELLLQDHLDVKHAVTVGSDALAILIAIKGLFDVEGEKITILGDCEQIIFDAVKFSSKEFQVVNTSPLTLQDEQFLEKNRFIIGSRTSFNNLDNKGAKIIMFSRELRQNKKCRFDNVVSIHSLSRDPAMGNLFGSVITTNNDAMASIFRNIRSSYGARTKVHVTATCNGRFSELQAGLGLCRFKKYGGTSSETG